MDGVGVTLDPVDTTFGTLEEIVRACIAFYKSTEERTKLDNVRRRRVALSEFSEKFHRDCGTLTPSVRKRLGDLRDGNCVVVMSAHQPNLFAYSGVLRKATLTFVLAKQLEQRLRVPVVNFLGVADQDFADDRWVKSSLLPAVSRRDGVLSIHLKLPETLLLNRVAKPSRRLLNDWKAQIDAWLENAVASVDRLCKLHNFPRVNPGKDSRALKANLESFWKMTEDCYVRSTSYADFNAFVMSRIVNEAWGYDTLFSRFSECQQAFADEIACLLARYQDYSRCLTEAHALLSEKGISSGVSAQESQLIPFWYHCDCGSKARLFASQRDGSLVGYGDCLGCDRHYDLEFGSVAKPDVSAIASRLSLRAISWILVFSQGLGLSCYVGGVGGLWYLMEVRYVADELGIPLPPTPVWRPHDRYAGIAQMEAVLELKRMCTGFGVPDLSAVKDTLKLRVAAAQKRIDALEAARKSILEKLANEPDDGKLRQELKAVSKAQTKVKKDASLSVICHELKLSESIPAVLNLIPSIIDYAVNVGLSDTSDQWVRYLNEKGSLSSDVRLESVLNQFGRAELDAVVLADADSSTL